MNKTMIKFQGKLFEVDTEELSYATELFQKNLNHIIEVEYLERKLILKWNAIKTHYVLNIKPLTLTTFLEDLSK